MGCSACAAASAARAAAANNTSFSSKSTQLSQGDCPYTDEILNVWLTKLKWFKDKGLYVKYKIEARLLNKYLGVVITSLNVNNKCVYRKVLDDVADLITAINGLE